MVTEVTLRVGDVARATGASARLLRYYEEQGLLAPARSPSGQRLYSLDDLERVARVRRLLDAGLSTTVIGQVLACACGGSGDVEPCLDPLLQEELARVDARLAQLAAHRERLAGLVTEAPASARPTSGGRSEAGDPTAPSTRARCDPALLLARPGGPRS
ncbi:MerR family transcriptional regulator [Cellulosimicrobium sp. 22601]|uniref:MerR family transcriptional regulator n=1 Tax=unclassified Cellulosimicrobium TaxID=2624466 RepID=UPI003F873437